MSGITYGKWTCPVCGTDTSLNESHIRNPLSRYNHLRWHEKTHPGTVERRNVLNHERAYCGYVVLHTLPNTASTGLGLSAAKPADTEPEVSPVAATGSQPSR